MPTSYQSQLVEKGDELPVVWELVQHDYSNLMVDHKPAGLENISVEVIYGTVLALLHSYRQLMNPDMTPDEIDLTVLEEMVARDKFGTEKYGVPLKPFCDHMPPLVDAWEELLDLSVYIRQHIFEKFGA